MAAGKRIHNCKSVDNHTVMVILVSRVQLTNLDLGPHVPSGTLGDELSPSGTQT